MLERELRELSFVPRWGVLRRVRSQSTAEHSYYVALYAAHVADMVGWNGDRGALLRSALVHDLPEAVTGDIPGPAKRKMMDPQKTNEMESKYIGSRFPDDSAAWHDAKLHPEIRLLIKAADLLDEIMFLATERQLGNLNAGHPDNLQTPLGNSYKRLYALWHDNPLLNDSGKWRYVTDAITAAGEMYSNIILDDQETVFTNA